MLCESIVPLAFWMVIGLIAQGNVNLTNWNWVKMALSIQWKLFKLYSSVLGVETPTYTAKGLVGEETPPP